VNLAQVARLLSGFILFFTLAQSIPLAVALAEPQVVNGTRPVAGFLAGIGLGLVVSLFLWLGGRKAPSDFFRREGLTVVALAWLMAGALGAIPLQWSNALPHGPDALFESVSGLTTTGASVLGTGDNLATEDLPNSLLLWRSMLQWMGGLGIILVFIVLLPAMGVTGRNLLASEQVGVPQEDMRPRMHEQARFLFRVYVTLTFAQFLALWVIAGVSPFDSVCHALTTTSTAGFSTKNGSIGSFDSLTVELIILLFMFLGGTNFVLTYSAFRHRFRNSGDALKNPEFRLYLLLTLGLIAVMTLILWSWGGTVPDQTVVTKDYGSFGRCLRDAAFNVVSILTSTGYVTADFQAWPKTALIILVFCMLIGGCTGSTAGGLKVLRLLVSLKLITYSIRHFIRPKSVEKIKLGGEVLHNSVISAILALVLLWLAAIALGTFALALDGRLDLLSAFSASLSMIGCTGPALTGVTEALTPVNPDLNLGPYGGYGDLYGWSKVLMSFQMILGRLEILAPLVVLAPSFWRR
jgi:trk system potassium uptake protein TrkH